MTKRLSDSKTRFETVLLQMREMVLSGELPPGARIQEIALGKRLGVSRTPVRNSLTVLEREGLVHGEANRGFTVRSFTTADVLAAYDVRSVLEGYACRVAAERGLTEQQELTLDGCLREGERLLAAGFFDANSIRAWTEMNGRFHATLVQASHNSALASALDLINQHPLAAPTSIVFGMNNLERLFRHMQQAQEDHAVVLTALRRRQVMRAEALMAEHIFKSRENLHDEIRRRGNDVPDLLKQLANRQMNKQRAEERQS